MSTAYSDEQIIEQAWQQLIISEENACWAILEREHEEIKRQEQSQSGIVYGVIDLSMEAVGWRK